MLESAKSCPKRSLSAWDKTALMSHVVPRKINVGQNRVKHLKMIEKSACPAWDKRWDKTGKTSLSRPTSLPLGRGGGTKVGTTNGDTMKIKSHRTEYAGHTFRSRLEATWAAFFDLCGISWSYEPIDLNGWVPDFALWLDVPIYVEVKPAPLALKIPGLNVAILQDGSQGFQKAKAHAKDVAVLLLGQAPNENADFFAIGTLMDVPDGPRGSLSWIDVREPLCVSDAKAKWGAALAATQWSPA